ncbi:MAG: gluconate 2-dehydrogenase subunit 3 family protein [Pseudomonadota bacterium]|nr:gluconate 2-dehydrogenase subunit 3 family protein [Pseudomonadota bacterium]
MKAPDQTRMDRRTMLRGTVTIAGAAVALPSMLSLGACSATPATLEGRMELISAIADRIIPATDTPGAIAANVPQYIAAVFEQHFTDEQRSEFVAGLGVLGDEGIAGASPEQQDTILTRFDTGDGPDAGKAAFQQLRDMTIFGFYTSEVAPQELAYEEIPSRYDGCVPLAEIGSAWLERGV